MAHLCVFACSSTAPDTPSPPVALCIHGFFHDMKEAKAKIEQYAADQPDVQSYIVEECGKWIPISEPVNGSGVEEEEIRAPENDDSQNGRMGSMQGMFYPPKVKFRQHALFWFVI